MSDVPNMPDDFWPDEFLVTARYKGAELAFAVTGHSRLSEMDANIKALFAALWQAVHVRHEADFATIRQDMLTAKAVTTAVSLQIDGTWREVTPA